MNISMITSPVHGKPSLFPTIYARCKRNLALCTGTLLLLFAGAVQAAPFGVGIAIENDMDSNGNITVVNGGKVYVSFGVDDPDKVSNKADKIQLLRVEDDSIVSSVARGKKKSGRVILVVKKSENEALYVRYIRKGKNLEILSVISHPGDPSHTPLLSIPKANLDGLTRGLYALESVPPKTYAIGDVGPAGGWVFHITDGGLHGLEAAPEDQGTVAWGCIGSNLDGADADAIGNGGQNTGDVLSGCMEASIAARKAANYWLNDYNDWFLPSRLELTKLGESLTPGGPVGGNKYLLENAPYHSSTQALVNDPTNNAYCVTLNGNPSSFGSCPKTNERPVRAIRAF